MNEQYTEVRKAAMELGFEQWWNKYCSNNDPEVVAKLNCYKGFAKAGWQARDEQVMAQSDVIEQLMREKLELKLNIRKLLEAYK